VYWFRRGRDFVAAAKNMLRKNARTNGEFYVAPVYNELVLSGLKSKAVIIDRAAMHGLGTPQDLEEYLANHRP
jgi:hypothetical protein